MQTPVPGRPPPQLADGRFLIIDALGEGGTATVYLCWDTRERQWCALKAMHRAILRDEEMVARFAAEAEALGRFRHPNIPRLVSYDVTCTPPYMVMELARSGSVMDWVKENGPMPPTLVADVVYQICQALDEAHQQGIVHRDVKPHNFLIDEDGGVKLTDFGIARWGDDHSLTATGSQIGTFSFMAPEQRSDTKHVDLRADVYSLGASLYTMLTGRTSAELFVADTDDALLADVSAPFRTVILKATQYRPEERYGGALHFQEAVLDALALISPARVVNVPPLARTLAPLPRRPPQTIPAETTFPELDGLLDESQGIPPPSPPSSREEQTERTIRTIGYTMPQRAQPQFARNPMDAGYIVSDHGATYVSDTDEITQNIAREVRREVQKALGVPEDDGMSGFGRVTSALVGLTGIVAALVFVVVVAGTGWVWWQELGHDESARTLRAVLHENGSVVYDIARDRSTTQAAFHEYETSRGWAQLAAAAGFVDLVEEAATHSERLDERTVRRLNRLRSARDDYHEALLAWEQAADAFPGSVAVRLGLASSPQPVE